MPSLEFLLYLMVPLDSFPWALVVVQSQCKQGESWAPEKHTYMQVYAYKCIYICTLLYLYNIILL